MKVHQPDPDLNNCMPLTIVWATSEAEAYAMLASTLAVYAAVLSDDLPPGSDATGVAGQSWHHLGHLGVTISLGAYHSLDEPGMDAYQINWNRANVRIDAGGIRRGKHDPRAN